MNPNHKNESDKLLYKLILQFSIYSRGSNTLLDPHLLNICKNIKQGINYHKLTPDLQALSKTLAHISHPQNKADDTPHLSEQEQQKYFINRLNKLLNETNIPLKFQNQCAILKQRSKGDLNDNAYKKVIDSALSLLQIGRAHV